MSVPDPLWVFRMVHVDNLRFILKYGLHAGTHPDQDPDYIFIGDSTLTQQRQSFPVPFDEAGNIGDYVAFYFSPRSPMLYNIHTGYRGIRQRPQTDIVYLCCRLDKLEEAGFRLVVYRWSRQEFPESFLHRSSPARPGRLVTALGKILVKYRRRSGSPAAQTGRTVSEKQSAAGMYW